MFKVNILYIFRKSLGFHNVAEFLDVGMEKAARKNESYAGVSFLTFL